MQQGKLIDVYRGQSKNERAFVARQQTHTRNMRRRHGDGVKVEFQVLSRVRTDRVARQKEALRMAEESAIRNKTGLSNRLAAMSADRYRANGGRRIAPPPAKQTSAATPIGRSKSGPSLASKKPAPTPPAAKPAGKQSTAAVTKPAPATASRSPATHAGRIAPAPVGTAQNDSRRTAASRATSAARSLLHTFDRFVARPLNAGANHLRRADAAGQEAANLFWVTHEHDIPPHGKAREDFEKEVRNRFRVGRKDYLNRWKPWKIPKSPKEIEAEVQHCRVLLKRVAAATRIEKLNHVVDKINWNAVQQTYLNVHKAYLRCAIWKTPIQREAADKHCQDLVKSVAAAAGIKNLDQLVDRIVWTDQKYSSFITYPKPDGTIVREIHLGSNALRTHRDGRLLDAAHELAHAGQFETRVRELQELKKLSAGEARIEVAKEWKAQENTADYARRERSAERLGRTWVNKHFVDEAKQHSMMNIKVPHLQSGLSPGEKANSRDYYRHWWKIWDSLVGGP